MLDLRRRFEPFHSNSFMLNNTTNCLNPFILTQAFPKSVPLFQLLDEESCAIL